MTDRNHTRDRPTQRAKTAAKKLREAEAAAESATVQSRKVAKEAFEQIKASRARAVKKGQ